MTTMFVIQNKTSLFIFPFQPLTSQHQTSASIHLDKVIRKGIGGGRGHIFWGFLCALRGKRGSKISSQLNFVHYFY